VPAAAAPGDAAVLTAATWLAVGLESGAVSLWRVDGAATRTRAGGLAWTWTAGRVGGVPPSIGHVATVRKLAWRPPVAGATGGDGAWVLASGSDDQSVRFLAVRLPGVPDWLTRLQQ
jgi:hypothetical protein